MLTLKKTYTKRASAGITQKKIILAYQPMAKETPAMEMFASG